MNIEHRTLNVQHRIMYSANLKKILSKANLPNKILLSLDHVFSVIQYSAVFRSRLQRDSLVLKSIKRSVINIGRSMFDVRRSMFDVQSVHCSGQADFHTSTAAGPWVQTVTV